MNQLRSVFLAGSIDREQNGDYAITIRALPATGDDVEAARPALNRLWLDVKLPPQFISLGFSWKMDAMQFIPLKQRLGFLPCLAGCYSHQSTSGLARGETGHGTRAKRAMLLWLRQTRILGPRMV